ncbi:uncharacterized protein si:ch211-142k18.1 [Erpetoichthys calabaricus]|uniref:uncharacterized protein si:ch211-142k18.1 n=1 Tax=Erpetoichthys calabaricus TaxID=27687 RepID=UPI00109F2D55|nr:uncharacterized protein si:ch211-142k18.1 [Erpetoichthys calabaricus]
MAMQTACGSPNRTMTLQCWLLLIALGANLVPGRFSQSADGENEIGSGDHVVLHNISSDGEARRIPRKTVAAKPGSPSGQCSITFHIGRPSGVSTGCTSHKLNTPNWQEELDHIKRLVHKNEATIKSLFSTITKDIGEEPYRDIITGVLLGIKEDNISFEEMMKKMMAEFETQRVGDFVGSLFDFEKVQEEASLTADLLCSTADIADRLERGSRELYSQLTKFQPDHSHRERVPPSPSSSSSSLCSWRGCV